MGWCHEFGPQISDGCDHPMVAGATACTCGECGAACTGMFAGCADVWARGPRLVAMRAPAPGRPESGQGATTDDATAGPRAGSAGEPEEAADGMGDDLLSTLLDELVARCERLEAGAAETESSATFAADARTLREALAATGRRLEQLASRLAPLEGLPGRLEPLEKLPARLDALEELQGRLAPLEKLPARLDALEKAPPPAPAPAHDEVTAVARGVEDLDRRLSSLEEVAGMVRALDQERGRLAVLDKVLAGLVKGGEALARRVEVLEAAPAPAVAASAPGADQAEVQTLMDRVAALESAPPVEPRVPAGLVKQMERLVSQLAELKGTPARLAALEAGTGRLTALEATVATLARAIGDLSKPRPATTDARTASRIQALDTVVTDMVETVGRLSARVAGLDEVPKRVEALEQASSPSEKMVASIARRVDRLSTQAAMTKELPQRVEALERAAGTPDPSPDRADALAVGLGHAIDMIDQLAHQVSVLEQAASAGPEP